ncbi:patatin-like phospholipase family protein [Cupriavidus basilensis]
MRVTVPVLGEHLLPDNRLRAPGRHSCNQLSTGPPSKIFKTPHHINFKRDHKFRIVDIAMATSAAPAYFARYTFNHNQFVDGGALCQCPHISAF